MGQDSTSRPWVARRSRSGLGTVQHDCAMRRVSPAPPPSSPSRSSRTTNGRGNAIFGRIPRVADRSRTRVPYPGLPSFDPAGVSDSAARARIFNLLYRRILFGTPAEERQDTPLRWSSFVYGRINIALPRSGRGHNLLRGCADAETITQGCFPLRGTALGFGTQSLRD